MSSTTSERPFTALDGDGLNPDEAAWATLADAAAEALTIADLSTVVIDELASIHQSCRGAAGQRVEL